MELPRHFPFYVAEREMVAGSAALLRAGRSNILRQCSQSSAIRPSSPRENVHCFIRLRCIWLAEAGLFGHQNAADVALVKLVVDLRAKAPLRSFGLAAICHPALRANICPWILAFARRLLRRTGSHFLARCAGAPLRFHRNGKGLDVLGAFRYRVGLDIAQED